MQQPWTVEQVLALAPDPASARAGRGLSGPGPWSDTGADGEPALVWGSCRGSGSRPYQAAVDLAGPAFRCSCPSRKFPCKHALGLLLLWAGGHVDAAEPPEWAATWRTGRRQRADRTAARASTRAQDSTPNGGPHGGDGSADPKTVRRRAGERAARVSRGLAELDRWLADQVRTGLSAVEQSGYGPVDGVAARMVDAQAPGVAARLRRLAGVPASGPGWPSRLVEEYALLHLLAAGHRRLDALPGPLAATVRAQVGYPLGREEVLVAPPLRDTWAVLGLRDSTEDRLRVRRVWLRGAASGRFALVLSYAAVTAYGGGTGAGLDVSLVPGTVVDADLHFYPGACPLRALVGARHAEPVPMAELAGGGDLADALAANAAALAADPWVDRWPVVLAAAVPACDGDTWMLADQAGAAIGLAPEAGDPWRLVAVSGGRPVTVAAEHTPAGLVPLSVFHSGRLVVL